MHINITHMYVICKFDGRWNCFKMLQIQDESGLMSSQNTQELHTHAFKTILLALVLNLTLKWKYSLNVTTLILSICFRMCAVQLPPLAAQSHVSRPTSLACKDWLMLGMWDSLKNRTASLWWTQGKKNHFQCRLKRKELGILRCGNLLIKIH